MSKGSGGGKSGGGKGSGSNKRSESAKFKRLKAQGKLTPEQIKNKEDQIKHAKARQEGKGIEREGKKLLEENRKTEIEEAQKKLGDKAPKIYNRKGQEVTADGTPVEEVRKAEVEKRAKEQKVIDEADEEGLTDLEKEQRRETPYGSNWFPDPQDFQFRDALKIIQQLNTVRRVVQPGIGGTIRNLLLINQGINRPI